ncbi:helix-turn-helix domain-containing protein [Salmonella enterica]|uniref:Helix-turn-helix domain-containing protein n=2 Tax=Citrobacter TaxID=544 RepID=A0AAW9M6P1_CITAM|nr:MULTISPECIES: STY4528 family pathogenicity island replication protein [Enterobacteriaceae]EAB4353745.1 helix-turn-helix domain-containing protein [Salmonella enterica]EBQ5786076.1 helix-turn-helix domain-containing protein [Salmonella enterica subsp. enterica serovar Infantis]EDD0652836.1 helix-turn-helix domain-containing protein [Salmonella enterica subsp. enterica serovar Westhampton]EAF5634078.1 helix-turn-helix domain-containing protein [Salmonella enterica subsp. enterica serovar Senft
MTIPADSIVAHTLSRMQRSLERRTDTGDVGQERSGLLFMGNVHDAFPRQLFLDTRLSPLDKTAWVMIRLYAQQNEGAVFPTYDELQVQLASAHSEKASRDTVSRVLLMLRLTGWLSLCKRVRDDHGRVRGNIYAQHDEPLGYRDAETFDPGWLTLVEESCLSRNKAVRMTALAVVNDILHDPGMRHRHSRLAIIESRLSAPATPEQMARQRQAVQPSPKSGLSKKRIKNSPNSLSPENGLSSLKPDNSQSPENGLSKKSRSYAGVRNSDCNVRSFTHSVNKKTYVPCGEQFLPDDFLNALNSEDRQMLSTQMASLPETMAKALADMLREQQALGRLNNPVGWMFSMLRRARSGELKISEDTATASSGGTISRPVESRTVPTADVPVQPAKRPSQGQVRAMIAAIRQQVQK